MRDTTTTPLVGPECKQQRQHVLTYAGVGLCCATGARLEQLIDGRTTVSHIYPKANE